MPYKLVELSWYENSWPPNTYGHVVHRITHCSQGISGHKLAELYAKLYVDYDGPLTDIESDINIVVPESHSQLTDHYSMRSTSQ